MPPTKAVAVGATQPTDDPDLDIVLPRYDNAVGSYSSTNPPTPSYTAQVQSRSNPQWQYQPAAPTPAPAQILYNIKRPFAPSRSAASSYIHTVARARNPYAGSSAPEGSLCQAGREVEKKMVEGDKRRGAVELDAILAGKSPEYVEIARKKAEEETDEKSQDIPPLSVPKGRRSSQREDSRKRQQLAAMARARDPGVIIPPLKITRLGIATNMDEDGGRRAGKVFTWPAEVDLLDQELDEDEKDMLQSIQDDKQLEKRCSLLGIKKPGEYVKRLTSRFKEKITGGKSVDRDTKKPKGLYNHKNESRTDLIKSQMGEGKAVASLLTDTKDDTGSGSESDDQNVLWMSLKNKSAGSSKSAQLLRSVRSAIEGVSSENRPSSSNTSARPCISRMKSPRSLPLIDITAEDTTDIGGLKRVASLASIHHDIQVPSPIKVVSVSSQGSKSTGTPTPGLIRVSSISSMIPQATSIPRRVSSMSLSAPPSPDTEYNIKSNSMVALDSDRDGAMRRVPSTKSLGQDRPADTC